MLPNRKARVATAIKSIRDFHELGRSLPKKTTHRDAYRAGTVDSEARRRGINPDLVRKARQFVDPVSGYSLEEVELLCRTLREIQTKQDESYALFSRSHIVRLLSVQKRKRASLQEAAIRKGWSTSELESKIAARYGIRRDGGRRRRLPVDLLGRIAHLEQMCESWRRWVALATVETEPDARKSPRTSRAFPPEIQRHIGHASLSIERLQTALTEELADRKPARSTRHRFRADGQSG